MTIHVLNGIQNAAGGRTPSGLVRAGTVSGALRCAGERRQELEGPAGVLGAVRSVPRAVRKLGR